MKKLIAKIREILRNRRVRKLWTRTVSSIACLVVFVTTYALVLPAITMESQASCGIEAHQHDDSCYEERLTCTIPESDGHTHTEDCYSTKQKLICDRSEHVHNSDCYDENGNLICSLEEHQHGKECFEDTRELVCGLEEAEGHHHDSSCYEKVLTCGKEAHTHSQACYRENAASEMENERAAVAATTTASEGGNTVADANGADRSSDAFGTLDPAQTDSEGFVPASDEANLQEPLNGNTAISNNSPAVDETRGSGNSDAGITSDDSSSAEENITEAVEETHPAVSFEDTLTVYTGSLGSDITGSLSSDTNAGNPGNDAAVSPDTDTAAGTLPASSNMTVSVSAEAGTFPAGTTMVLSAVTDMDAVAEALEGTVDSKTRGFQAVDISFRDKDGNEIEPLKPISVTMRSDSIKAATEDSSMAPVVVHVEDRNKETVEAGNSPAATVIETLPDTAENKEQSETPAATNSPDAISFEADAFSVYAIVYTVDFHYEVNGKMYEFSIPGGGFASFYKIVEVLGISELGTQSSSGDENAAENSEIEAGNGENTPENDVYNVGEETGVEGADAYNDAISLNNVEVSEATREFVEDVASVKFSSPELVWVGKVDEETTVDGLKEANGLEAQYSAELTQEQIEEINTQTVEAGDWALISMQPFDTEETLTVTMKNGEVFTIQVRDAQLMTSVLAADGNTYNIEVTFDEREPLPYEAFLEAVEIEQETSRYYDYLAYSVETMQLESMDDIAFARFFDITVRDVEGDKYEPIYPAQVKITYAAGFHIEEEQTASVIHFADDGVEIIRDVDVSGDGTEFVYQQDSFSVSGTVVNVNNLQDGGQYVLYIKSENNYYAMTHYSEGRDVDYVAAAKLDNGSTNTNGTISVENYDSNIVWTVNRGTTGSGWNQSTTTYYTFSYTDDNGNTYYLRDYGGLMVGTDDLINESGYQETTRKQWTYSNGQLATRKYSTRSIRFNTTSLGFGDRTESGKIGGNAVDIYFARVDSVTPAPSTAPMIHYVDESGNELTVVNGRDWETDNTTSPAYLIYDIDGYEYVKTTLDTVSGTQIRPLIRRRAQWQYTTSTSDSSSITWSNLTANQDIYVVYKHTEEPVSGGTPKVKESSSTEDPVDPVIHKGSVSNGDGTNTLSLSITADTSPLEVEKLADVIVIVDVSSSMTRSMSNSTRMAVAKNTINNLAETLIGEDTTYQDSDENKLIRMALVKFSQNGESVQDFTDDISTYKRAVNGLTTGYGTNWEDALNLANYLSVDPERATFVIFVTDGNPSYRMSRGNLFDGDGYPETVSDGSLDIYKNHESYQYRVNSIFGALDEYDQRNANTAYLTAKSIVDHGKNLYCIGIGDAAGVSRLQELTSYAYSSTTIGAARTKTAETEEELADAFSDIVASIVAELGWGDIVMTDGITSLANTVEKSGLLNLDGNFEYWKAPAPEGWDSMTKAQKAAFLESYVPDDDAFVSWDPSSENCHEAEYDEEIGSVIWNMGHSFVPESGATYKVTFRVWPSQEAYDILANLKNGTVTYEGLTDAQKAQIVDLGGGNYSLKTNDKDPNTTYKPARKTGDGVTTSGEEQTIRFNDVDPMVLVPERLTVKKDWDYDIGDSHKATALDFRLMVGDKYYQNDGTFKTTADDAKILPVSESSGWTNSINIAPGIVILNADGSVDVLETGHDYTLDEFNITNDGTPFEASYEFTTQTVRPMILTVEGSETYHATLAYLVKIDDDNPAVAGKDQFTIGDSTYYVASVGSEGTVVGTNHRKSELDITKLVVDTTGKLTDTDLDAETFTYRVTLTVPKDTDCSQMTAYEFVYRADDDPRLNGNTPFEINGYQPGDGYIEGDGNKAGAHYRSYTVKKGSASIADSFTLNDDNLTKSMTMDITLNRTEVLRFTNLPTGTTYSIEEIYANYRQADPSRDVDATGSDKESNVAEQGYTTSYKTKTTDGTTVSGSGRVVTGEITELDIRYYNQFTNTLGKTADIELKVKKALDGLEWTSGSRFYFKLTAVDGAPLPTGVGSNTGRTQFYISNTTPDHTYSFGKIRYTQAGTYRYRITETNSNWVSIAGQMINGIQYAPEETITVTVAEQDGKLVVRSITGSGSHTVTAQTDGSALVVGTTTITNSSVSLPIQKIDSNTRTQLTGATFELLDGHEKLYFDSSNVILTASQVQEIIEMTVSDEGAAAAMEEKGITASFTIGKAILQGLAYDTVYTLHEIQSPEGYIIASNDATFKLTRENDEIKITVTGTNAEYSVDDDGILTLEIANTPGTALPNTGGPGTWFFTILGSSLSLGAGVLLWRRRKLI